MNEQTNHLPPERKSHKQRKNKAEIIKEAYLPYLFLMLAALLIIIFIIGALIRNGNTETLRNLSYLQEFYL